MNVELTVINKDVPLTGQKILAYLKPQSASSDWMTSAWAFCAPQGGGKTRLPAITSDVSAYGTWDNNSNETATVVIPAGHMSHIVQTGNVVAMGNPELDGVDLSKAQSGVQNKTNVNDMYVVWCVNGRSVCRSKNAMMNTGFSSFELLQSVYFTIGSETRTEQFVVQNWTALVEIKLDPSLISADITVSLNKSSNKPEFEISNKKYA